MKTKLITKEQSLIPDWQQGDCIFLAIDLPKGLEENKEFDGIVQWGETTGHKHALRPEGKYNGYFKLFVDGKVNKRYLRILKDTPLVHEEHNPITLPKGDYEIRIVRELDWFSDMEREVID